MNYRQFGRTNLRISEIGFGAWAIGGRSYGVVDKEEAFRALTVAEEHGCNFVDTAAVYGDSEAILGEFLQGRRDKWIVATKYSGQPEGVAKLAETQLRRLKTDHIDFYQLHWVPAKTQERLYEELAALKRSGKARYIGVSLYSTHDIDRVLRRDDIDGFQVPCSLLQPDPYLARLDGIRSQQLGVIVRSALKEGFLSGKFSRTSTFPDTNDQRHQLTPRQIGALIEQVEAFRFLEKTAGSLFAAAASYPLAFPETSTVILGTKSAAQAQSNFNAQLPVRLSAEMLRQIERTQRRLGLKPTAARQLIARLIREARLILKR